jgi:hypothetical protein
MIYKIPVILFACFLFPGCGIKLVHEHVLTPDESKEVLEKELAVTGYSMQIPSLILAVVMVSGIK